jgi:hypothetical protein
VNAEKILAHCEKARATGRGTWIACCPAHEDKNPSMTVRELDDGMVLVHCFAGCSAEAIISACGLEFDDLFPDKLERDFTPAQKRRFPAADVLLMVERELDVVQIVADEITRGRCKPEDAERIRLARDRIREARRLALGDVNPWLTR